MAKFRIKTGPCTGRGGAAGLAAAGTERGHQRPRRLGGGPLVLARHARFAPAGLPAEKLEAGRSQEIMRKPGRTTLVLGPPSAEPYRLFKSISRGRRGLVISGVHPDKLQARYGLGGAELLWLTGLSGTAERALGPKDLEYEVLGRALKHLRAGAGGAILLDDLDYLASQAGFPSLVRFVKGVSDAASELGGVLLSWADPDAFSEREKLVLVECFDGLHLIRAAPSLPCPSERAILLRRGTYLFIGHGPAAYRFLATLGRARKVLCLTTLPPSKLKERYALQDVDFLWLSDTASGDGVLRPGKLGFEVQSAAARHLRSGEGALLYIDGLERLAPYAPFPDIVRFVKGLADTSGEFGGVLVASIQPGFFKKAEEAVLRKRFDMVLS